MSEKRQQTVSELWNSRPKSQQQMDDEDDRAYGTFADPDCPEDGYSQQSGTFAELFAATRPTEKSSAAHLVYPPGITRGSASTIAAAITPREAEEPEDDEPAPRGYAGVPELVELYKQADTLYDERTRYGGTEDMTVAEFRTYWGRRR